MHEAEAQDWTAEETLEVAKRLNFDWTTNPLTKYFEKFLAARRKK